ncbi:MAG: DUF3754 domain-containing protein, partial [Merismopedia sp. SIO2A8]|nr:DUF3754 domain-containing protein [Merismopedia sp. SIO2A8]
DVNFQDFQKFLCYYRGDIDQQIEVKGFLGRRKKQIVDIFERVVLLIQFQNEAYYIKKGIDPKKLNFTPGKMYLYFYKDVPKYDLELLFPNVKTWMTWKDRLMLLVPAIGAGIGIVIKVLPQISLLLLALLVSLNINPSKVPDWLSFINSQQSNAVTNNLAILVTTLSVLMVLGGFVAKQYTTYKSKKIQFQKHVTDTLFFRSMANHSAVFQLLVDVAEEEECKEVILAYYHLLISPRPLSAEELDEAVETWMHQRLNVDVDFDIQDALDKLQRLQETTSNGSVQGLVVSDRHSRSESKQSSEPTRYHAASIPDAKYIIDRLWDNAFRYNC